jgi:hypothetical protein
MQRALTALGRTRRYIATDPRLLFDGKSEPWARKYSTSIGHGWYADTNLNRRSMRRLLSHAIRAAGLLPGKDVTIYWCRTNVAPPSSNSNKLLGQLAT